MLKPPAQELHAAFGPGADERPIAALDTNGVALSAVQELIQINREQNPQIAELEQENAELEDRIATLELLVETLASQHEG